MSELQQSEVEALQAIGLSAATRQQWLADPDRSGDTLQRVVEVHRDQLRLHNGFQERNARARLALLEDLRSSDDGLAVGDWVRVRDDASGDPWVVDRLPPQRQLARRGNDGHGGLKRQVLVSNVDTALLVMGLDHDFNLRRLERYLALTRLAQVAVVLVLSKADTVAESNRDRRLSQARACLPPQTPAFALDGRSPAAATVLAPWLTRGQTAVLLGSSGAGKSTLTNVLTGADHQAAGLGDRMQVTAAVRADDSRGRHTTTVRTLRITPAGACIIDTPGLRALRLDVGDASELAAVFGDVAEHAVRCRFRDCRHQQEPDCAVRGSVPDQRLRSFHKLQREAQRDSMTALQRREQLSEWKARGRAGNDRVKAKHQG